MTRKILMTGGPVHAHIDDVKIVTNRFRGGLMALLADELALKDCDVVYITAPGAEVPKHPNVMVMKHQGYDDYRKKVLTFAPEATDVILGAAVANLIPKDPIKGKFPSHNYKEGDVVSLDFIVTPRVITEVKTVAPNVNLFGFKLLSGASHEELMAAAWHTLISSRAISVIANDANDLQSIFALTKEGGEHPMSREKLPEFMWTLMNEEHYRTVSYPLEVFTEKGLKELKALIARYRDVPGFFIQKGEMIFGTVAYKAAGGFWTTGRGKHELDEVAAVMHVVHDKRTVMVNSGKASLNAPLLHYLLYHQDFEVQAVVHGHVQDPSIPTLPYATPGTVRDSIRKVGGSFNIAGHGCFLLFDKAGNRIEWK